MKLADKPCYPVFNSDGGTSTIDYNKNQNGNVYQNGLTFRERLIITLASNPNIIQPIDASGHDPKESNALRAILQADAIIKEMEKV